jgi:predicted lipoprotein with Yx(FWY)xxD motif
MNRISIILTGVLAVAAGAAGVASAQTDHPTAHTSRATEVALHRTSLGEILSTGSGVTLYEFTRDRGSNSCVHVSGCSQIWPALQTSGRPTAGAGVRSSLLSTIRLSTGASQVTYAGHPLYLYRGDSEPGDTSYVGANQFGGSWYALDAAGHTVK